MHAAFGAWRGIGPSAGRTVGRQLTNALRPGIRLRFATVLISCPCLEEGRRGRTGATEFPLAAHATATPTNASLAQWQSSAFVMHRSWVRIPELAPRLSAPESTTWGLLLFAANLREPTSRRMRSTLGSTSAASRGRTCPVLAEASAPTASRSRARRRSTPRSCFRPTSTSHTACDDCDGSTRSR